MPGTRLCALLPSPADARSDDIASRGHAGRRVPLDLAHVSRRSEGAEAPAGGAGAHAVTHVGMMLAACPDYAARLPNLMRFSFCLLLRGGSLNSRAAVPPRM